VEVQGGAQMTETSGDPQAVLLIRRHARRVVSEFVAGGMRRVMRSTPLPEGYPQGARPSAFFATS
jgi:hypothetical protein